MSITAKDVNELRKLTGAGLMDCKKALTEADGDVQAAIDYLRKKGQKVSELRSGRDANEGVVIAATTEDKKKGVVVHVTSETDFVARNQDFISFAQSIADAALKSGVDNMEDLLKVELDGATIKDKLAEKVGSIGENIGIASFEKLEGDFVVPYIHAGNKIGVLVSMNKAGNGQMEEMGRDIAMQVAAMNPIAVDQNGVPEDVQERELAIGKEQALAEGKPENIIEKIAQGKLNKFFKENTLVNQQFVKDGSKTVAQVLKEVNQDLKINDFKRVALGN